MVLSLLARYRLRLFFRGVFLLLAISTLILAVSVLQQEKQLSYYNYQNNFKKTQQQIAATLRHPTGQMALLNPPSTTTSAKLHPLLLPFSALDFDDQNKVQQAIAMSGCLLQYGADATLCVGIGNNPWAGGYIYVAGSFASTNLVSHKRGDQVLNSAHRMRVSVSLPGQEYQWIALFEEEPANNKTQGTYNKVQGTYGRLTGFLASNIEKPGAKPERDFRAWIWQKPSCVQTETQTNDVTDDCKKHTFFSLRLPIPVMQEALFEKRRPVWPPEYLDQTQVDLVVFPPNSETPLFDSKKEPTSAPFSLNDLQPLLLPGENLKIKNLNDKKQVIDLTGKIDQVDESWNLLTKLIRRLPVDAYDTPLENTEVINTPLDSYEILLKGDVRSVSKSLSVVATRVSWYVGAMLFALFLAWLLIEIGIIHRITILTKRADALSTRVMDSKGIELFDISNLRNNDELGILASCLHNLLRRVKEDVDREKIRTEQEKDLWHAVGHEIMSPLQSLMALHGNSDDQSYRYIQRMQQAIRILYGSASPSEAFQSTTLQIDEVDITTFLQNIAENAQCVGIPQVEFNFSQKNNIIVKADEYSLEDVITHILRNADRYRTSQSTITINLESTETLAVITIHNYGPSIAPELMDKIFEYGVSDQPDSGANGNRGQGLFVAKTYMAKMGGTIVAENTLDGVKFILSLQRGNTKL
jgi:signal transduction histidine kinase